VRVILLGGSTTHGFGVNDGQTIDEYMREDLRQRYPRSHFEVVNLAFDGYDSYQLLERFRNDGLRLHPNVVIFNEGINDVRNAWFPNLKVVDPRTLIWESVLTRLREEQLRGGPSLWTLAKHYLFLARTPGYVRQRIRLLREAQHRQVELRLENAESADGDAEDSTPRGPPYPEAAEYFERNVRQITTMALKAGAVVLLSTPPSALRSYAPTAKSNRTYWIRDAKTTQEYRDRLAGRLQSIATDEAAQGHAVRYLAPRVSPTSFIDDCHLTPIGNQEVAAAFVQGIESLSGRWEPAVTSIAARPAIDGPMKGARGASVSVVRR
jgi:lysophospholipase L1-like esterase